jgi:hypothetical protein
MIKLLIDSLTKKLIRNDGLYFINLRINSPTTFVLDPSFDRHPSTLLAAGFFFILQISKLNFPNLAICFLKNILGQIV